MVRSSLRARSRAGNTLVEMCVVLTLMGSAFGSLLALGTQSTRLVDTGISHSELEVQARRALERLTQELATSQRSEIVANLPDSPDWQEFFQFNRAAEMEFDDGQITWSTSRIELRYATGETDNGIDDDGNGLVDEGMLVLVRDEGAADELELVLARGVTELLEGELPNNLDDNGNGLKDERGATFERSGDDLRIHLSLQAFDGERRLFTRTLTTTVFSRN